MNVRRLDERFGLFRNDASMFHRLRHTTETYSTSCFHLPTLPVFRQRRPFLICIKHFPSSFQSLIPQLLVCQIQNMYIAILTRLRYKQDIQYSDSFDFVSPSASALISLEISSILDFSMKKECHLDSFCTSNHDSFPEGVT